MTSGFRGIVGNENGAKLLSRLAERGGIGNAFLFCGPAGSGKHLLASRFIAATMCRDHGCGKCRTCELIEKGIHPDVLRVGPAEGKKSIGVEEIRELKKEAYKTPVEADLRFILIDEADKMTVQAQNALLLILEEPPETTVFVLFSETREALLPTVLSRTATVATERVSPAEIKKYLIGKGEDEAAASRAARLSEGNIGRAESDAFDGYAAVSDMLRSFALKRPFAAYERFFSRKFTNREELSEAAEKLYGAARDLIVYKNTGNIEDAGYYGDDDVIKKAAPLLSEEGLYKLAELAAETAEAADKNCNVSLLAMNLFIKGWECFND